MADINEYIGNKGNLYDFCQQNNLIDSISLLNPEIEKDSTYLWGPKVLITFLNPSLIEAALKAGHHDFRQNVISDHKGVYI